MKPIYKATMFVASLMLLAAAVLALGGQHDAATGFAMAAVVQSAYNDRIAAGLAGDIATMSNWNADTRVCETAAGIGFGLAVGRGTEDKGAVLGSTAATDFLGISVRDITLVTQASQTVDKYQDGDNMSVLTEGDIWVAVGAAVVDGDNVTYVASTGVLSSIAADGTHFAITGARWMTTQATAGGLAKLRLTGNLPSA